jgi:pimeloyl-ACP methyl ester carboxylesterase
VKVEVNGLQSFVGTGSGKFSNRRPCVIFLHGAGMDHSVWVMPSRYFARHGFSVVAPDFPAHGRSAGEPLRSITAMADWLKSLLDALQVDQAAVVGHSMGSLVAMTFAKAHPERCRALALLGTSAPMPVTERLLSAAQDDDHAAIEMANTWSHSPRGQIGANDNPGLWMLGVGSKLIERCAPGVFHADLTACNEFAPDQLAGPISCPTLVIAGSADQMTPQRAGAAVADATDARLLVLPGCGHSMLSECPNEVLDALDTIV